MTFLLRARLIIRTPGSRTLRYRNYSIKRARRLLNFQEGRVCFEITFLKSLTTVTINRFYILCTLKVPMYLFFLLRIVILLS